MTDTYEVFVQWILQKDVAADLQSIVQNYLYNKEALPEWFDPEIQHIPYLSDPSEYHFKVKEPDDDDDDDATGNYVLLEIYTDSETLFPIYEALSAVLQHHGDKHFYKAFEMYTGRYPEGYVYGISAEGVMAINTNELATLSKPEMERIIAILENRDSYD